jgi:uncharacterized peroxidase-related enzyme
MDARINMINYEDSEGELRDLYDRYNGKMANILKVQSLNTKSLLAHLEYYKVIMFGKSPLSRKVREMIATVVSATNECFYWMEHHGAALHLLTKDEELVKGLREDYRNVSLDEKTRAILDYAVKLTIKPHSVKAEDVQNLKNVGCDDVEVLDICQITSYFNFVNRMAEGLGVKLEEEYVNTSNT